jgi:hypothetical protein
MGPDGRYHLTILIASLAVLAASLLLTADPQAVYFYGSALPESCLFKRATGIECFGCGLTRSFVYMGHLDPAGAFALHKLGPLLYSAVVAQLPYRGWRLLSARIGWKGPK